MSEGNTQVEPPPLAAITGEVKVDEQQQEKIRKYIRAVTLYAVLWMLILAGTSLPVLFFVEKFAHSAYVTHSWLVWQPLPGWQPLQWLAVCVLCTLFIGTWLFLYSFFTSYVFARHYRLATRIRTFSEWLMKWLRFNSQRWLNWLFLLQCCALCVAIQPLLWWLWIAILLACISCARAYFAPIYGFRRMKRTVLSDERLITLLYELCAQNKTSVHHFFVLESKKPGQIVRANAHMAGWGKTSSILLNDGLLKAFSPAEIKVTIAHELGHHIYRHMLKKQGLNFILLLVELFLDALLYHWFLLLNPFFSMSTSVPLLLFILCALIFEARLIFLMIKNTYSRHHEFWADEFALRATLDVPAFKNTMVRLGKLNDAPFKLASHQEMGRTHPTTLRRLQHADEFAIRLAQARAVSG